MKKTLLLAILTIFLVTAFACNSVQDKYSFSEIAGRYDVPNLAENYEYQYLEIKDDGTWTLHEKLIGENEVLTSGEIKLDGEKVIFEGNNEVDITFKEEAKDRFAVELNDQTFTYEKPSANKLAAPLVFLDGGELEWGAVTNATEYLIYVNDELIDTITDRSYLLVGNENFAANTNYYLKVVASTTNSNYSDSNPSSIICYSFALPKLPSPIISITEDDFHMSWSEIDNAIGYYVYIDNVFLTSTIGQDENYLPFSWGTNGTFSVGVVAVGDGIVYNNSDMGIASWTTNDCHGESRLPAPTIAINNNIITWNDITNAEGYDLYNNGFLYREHVKSGVVVNPFEIGTYSFSVMAKGDISTTLNSTLSNKVEFVQNVANNTLSTPTLELIDFYPYDSISELQSLSWSSVPSATSYRIMEGEILLYETEETYYQDLYAIADFAEGSTHLFTVIAVSDDENINNSLPSNSVSYVINSPQLDKSGDIALEIGCLAWQHNDWKATHYEVYVNDSLELTTEAIDYDVFQYGDGKYRVNLSELSLNSSDTIKVKAIDSTGKYLDSEFSNPYTYS